MKAKLAIAFRKKWGLLIVLGLAAILRLYKISDYMEFLGDQGRDVMVVYRLLTKGDLMFIGPQTSIGNMYLGPWYYYLMAPFLLLFGFNPVGPAVMIALLGVATVWLVWKMGNYWFGNRCGLIAAFLYAVSPIVIKFSNFSWNPNIMPFLALLSVWLVWGVWQEKKYSYLVWLGLVAGLVINSHYLGLLLFPFWGLFWVLSLRKAKREEKKVLVKKTALGALIFFGLLLPQLIFDLKHHWTNVLAMKTFFTVRQTTVNLKFYKAIPYLWPLATQMVTRLAAGKDVSAGVWLSAFLFGGWLFFTGKNIRQQNREATPLVFIAVWVLSGLIGLGIYKQHIYDHYFGFLFPAPFLVLAYLVTRISRIHLAGKIAAGLMILGLCFLSLVELPFRYPPNRQLARTKKIASYVLTESGSRPFSLGLIAEQNYDPPYRYFLTLQKAALVDLHEQIPEQLFVICEPWGKVNCNPIGHPQWEVAAFGWAKIIKETEIDGVKIYTLAHNRPET